jgi:quercetin dioxygenase-like cupin family protein
MVEWNMNRILIGVGTALAFSVIATLASAQPANPIKRTVLQQLEYPDGHITYLMMIEIPPNFSVPPHTHPGAEVSYVVEGEMVITLAGKPPLTVKAGDTLAIPANVVHHGKMGPAGIKLLNTFVLEKNKPISSPVPQ